MVDHLKDAPSDFDLGGSLKRWIGGTIWLVACLFGPIPWLILATVVFEGFAGSPGVALGFIGAPALWCALTLGAVWLTRRWIPPLAATAGLLLLMTL